MTLDPKSAARVATQAAINRAMEQPVVIDVICPNCHGKTRVTRRACRHCHTVIPKEVRDNAPKTRGEVLARSRDALRASGGGEAPAAPTAPTEKVLPNRAQRRRMVRAGHAEEIAVAEPPQEASPLLTLLLASLLLLFAAAGCAGRVVVDGGGGSGEAPAAQPQVTAAPTTAAGPTLAQLAQPQPAAAVTLPNDTPSELLGVFDAINRALKARDWIDLRLAFIAGAKRCGQLPEFRSTAARERDGESKGAKPERNDTEKRGEAAHDELDRRH